jgi:tetratricopeptide (TPR) repeat protein
MYSEAAPASGRTGPIPDPNLDALESEYARDARWEELIGALIERAASSPDAGDRQRSFLRAARVYEDELGDVEKAYITLQAAFAEDYTSPDAAASLERVTKMLGRAPALVEEHEAALPGVEDPAQRAALLVRLAHWHQSFLEGGAAAEAHLNEALAVDPGSPVAARALAEIHARRGEWARAALLLARAGLAETRPGERLTLLLAAADVYESKLDDSGQAADLYAKVLEIEPAAGAALEGLSDICFEREEWSRALPLLERLADSPGLPAAERARVHQRASLAALKAGDEGRARANARAVLDADPTAVAFARDWTDTAASRGWWEDVRAMGEPLLAREDGGLSPQARLDLTARVGRALMESGEPRRAVALLEGALAGSPDHAGCREAVVEAHTRMGDAAAALQHKKAMAGAVASPDDRSTMLLEVARTARDTLKNNEAALASFQEALALRPGDRAILSEMLELHTELEQWKSAVDILLTLAEGEEPGPRGKYLVAAANILHYQLKASDEAVELYDRVLDADPSDLKTFERIDKILTAKRAWRDEARAYRRMIKRLGSGDAEQRPTLLMLWRGLAEIYRTRLEDLPAAAAALEVCTQLGPDSLVEQERLAEILEAGGPDQWRAAVERRTVLLERAPDVESTIRQLRALRTLYHQARAWDRVFSVCAALVVLDAADGKEREFYQRLAGGGAVTPRAALTEEIWQKVIYHPTEERRLSLLFACLAPTIALVRAQEMRAFGLSERSRLDPARDPSPVGRLFELGSRFFGMPMPALFVHTDIPTEVGLANVRDQNAVVPTLLVRPDVVNGRSEREIAFIVGRNLALTRYEHLVLWPQVVASTAELHVIVRAALRLCLPSAMSPSDDEVALQKYLALFQRMLPPQTLEPLTSVMPWVAENLGALDLDTWRTAAERTADRAGLLFSGDLGAAVRVLRETRGPTAGAAIADLVRWSASDAHLGLREVLGITAVPEGWDPRPPAPEPRIVQRG